MHMLEDKNLNNQKPEETVTVHYIFSQLGYPVSQLSDDRLMRDITRTVTYHADSLWFPGYYEKWFCDSNGGFKEHANYLCKDDYLGPISVSFINDEASSSLLSTSMERGGDIRALVRSELGFHGIHIRSGTQPQARIKPSKAARHPHYTILAIIMESFLNRLRQMHEDDDFSALAAFNQQRRASYPQNSTVNNGSSNNNNNNNNNNGSTPRRQFSGILLRSPKGRKRADSAFDQTAINGIDAGRLVDQMELVPFPDYCRNFLDLEKRSKSISCNIDIVRTIEDPVSKASSKFEWNRLLCALGDESKKSQGGSKQSLLGDGSDKPNEILLHTLDELVATEKRYLDHLKVLSEVFIRPIKIRQLLPTPELPPIFQKIEKIIPIHEQLHAALKLMRDEDRVNVGDVLAEFVDRLSDYRRIISIQKTTQDILRKFMALKGEFTQFVESAEKHPGCDKLGLDGLLIEVTQRLPRYELYLKIIKERMSVDHPDYPSVEVCLQKINALNRDCNEQCRVEEGQVALFTIKEKTDKYPNFIITASRLGIISVEMTLVDPSHNYKDKGVKYLVFLMNDSIMFAKKRDKRLIKMDEKQYKFKHFMRLGSCELVSLDDRGLKSHLQFRGIPAENDDVVPLKSDGLVKQQRALAETPSELSLNSMESKEIQLNSNANSLPTDSVDTGDDDGTVQYVFKAPDGSIAAEFLQKFRAAKEALHPVPPKAESTNVLKLWVKDNMELVFNIYDSIRDYSLAEQKSDAVLFFTESQEALSELQRFSKVDSVKPKVAGLLNAVTGNRHSMKLFAQKQFDLSRFGITDGSEQLTGNAPPLTDQALVEKLSLVSEFLLCFHCDYQESMASSARCNLAAVTSTIKTTSPLHKLAAGKEAISNLGRRLSVISVSEIMHSGRIIKTVPISEDSMDLEVDGSPRPASPAVSVRKLKVGDYSAAATGMIKRSASFLSQSFGLGSLNPTTDEKQRQQREEAESTLSMLRELCADVERRGLDIDRLYIIDAPISTAEECLRQLKGKNKILQSFSPQIVATALKLWIKQSSELAFPPLLSQILVGTFHTVTDIDASVEMLRKFVCVQLPENNYHFLDALMAHLEKVLSNSAANFCQLSTLADSWSMVLFPAPPSAGFINSNSSNKNSSPNSAASTVPTASSIIKSILNNRKRIFTGYHGASSPGSSSGGSLNSSNDSIPSATSSNIARSPNSARRSLLTKKKQFSRSSLSLSFKPDLERIDDDEGFHSLPQSTESIDDAEMSRPENIANSTTKRQANSATVESNLFAADMTTGSSETPKATRRPSAGKSQIPRVPPKYPSLPPATMTPISLESECKLHRSVSMPSAPKPVDIQLNSEQIILRLQTIWGRVESDVVGLKGALEVENLSRVVAEFIDNFEKLSVEWSMIFNSTDK